MKVCATTSKNIIMPQKLSFGRLAKPSKKAEKDTFVKKDEENQNNLEIYPPSKTQMYPSKEQRLWQVVWH